MTGYLNIILRLTIWFLLTADLSWANIVIGVGVTILLPRGVTNVGLLKDWLRTLGEVAVAIPQAYKEAFEIMLYPHREETVVLERVKPRRTPSLIFLDIFLITFTPKTIVQRYHSRGWYEVHYIQRRETP
ncbi:cation:proton antiporter [Nodosilinea sp. LEGE 07298]|jgi:multicomponent Na+:H+ antiporter subunit E|uniref:cation:proton antiporter n=1 Tax=Nodosilinea sp. LEGE 07298 TaxID=2777970 RepID=UPI00188215AB|nr:cation:proton antiporter [Nodosilinea sp. LEGE 07298]MBE9112483.1 cation:proton antiporter [Nodosilinea sp. LEGE 07298]